MTLSIRELRPADYPSVAAIYAEGIAHGDATFETRVRDWAGWNAAMRPDCRLVIEGAGTVLGWAALSPTSSRAVYAGLCEVSIYLSETARGRGLGKRLLQALIDAATAAGVWTLQAGIFPENAVSLALHRRCGFRTVGVREKLGRMADGRWRDVILLERRAGA